MLNVKNLASVDVLMMNDLGKLIKATHCVYFIFEEDNIIAYGMQDFMFSTISRIIVPNTTIIRGTIVLRTLGGFTDFCKTVIPFTDIAVDYINNRLINTMTTEECPINMDIESAFNNKKDNLNQSLANSIGKFSVDDDAKALLKQTISSMKAATNQKMFKLADGYLVTAYSGMLPLNKADQMNIDIIYSSESFLCKYEIIKKKAPAPIHIFIKYRRL